MFSTDEFAKFADQVVLFLHNTSHVDDEPYPNLLFEKGGNAWPTVSFLDADGRRLHQVTGLAADGLGALEKGLEALRRWRALRDELAGGDSRELFLLEMQLGMLAFAEADARYRRLEGLDGEQRADLEQKLVNLEFTDLLQTRTSDNEAALGARYLSMLDRDRIPDNAQVTSFWQFMLKHAEVEEDPALFARILDRAKKAMAGDPRVDRYLGRVERQLQQLRERVAEKKARRGDK